MDRLPNELRDRVISLRRGRGWGPDRIHREMAADLDQYGITPRVLSNWIYKAGNNEGLAQPVADRLGRVAELLERSGIDPADIGKVQSVRLSEWQGLTKNAEGEAEMHDLTGASVILSPEWAEGPRWQTVDRGPAVRLPRPLAPSRRTDGLRQAVVIPDVQIGYRRDLDHGGLVPFHDEVAMAAALRVVRAVDPDDLIVLGDFVDFPTFSRFEQEPGFALTTQPAVDRATMFLAELAAAAPRSTIRKFIEGNHDRRIQKTVTNNALAAFGLRPGCAPPDTWPDLSVPHLLRVDELGFDYVGGYPAGIHWVNENLACIHGHRVNSAGSTAARVVDDSRISVIFGHCFDDETEILTPNGWVRHDHLRIGTRVMTLDRGRDALEWNSVSDVWRYTHHKEMVSVESQSVSLLVTPDHGLWATTGKTWTETTAAEAFGKNLVFPLAGLHDDEELPVGDDMLRCIAWVLTEGSVDKNGHVRISQSDAPDRRTDRLEAALRGAGIPFSKILRYDAGSTVAGVYRRYDAYRYNLHRPNDGWGQELFKYVGRDKSIHRALAGMSVRQARLFLDTWVDGDGSANGTPNCRSRQVGSVRRDHVDFLQEMCVRSGFRSIINPRPRRGKTPFYCLTLSPRTTSRVQPSAWRRVPYDGVSWCVTVPNGTLVVRRHGKTVITLNTHRIELQHRTRQVYEGERSSLAASPGCLARIDGTVPSTRGAIDCFGRAVATTENWQHGLAVVTYEPGDGWFDVELLRILRGVVFFRGELLEPPAAA